MSFQIQKIIFGCSLWQVNNVKLRKKTEVKRTSKRMCYKQTKLSGQSFSFVLFSFINFSFPSFSFFRLLENGPKNICQIFSIFLFFNSWLQRCGYAINVICTCNTHIWFWLNVFMRLLLFLHAYVCFVYASIEPYWPPWLLMDKFHIIIYFWFNFFFFFFLMLFICYDICPFAVSFFY